MPVGCPITANVVTPTKNTAGENGDMEGLCRIVEL